MLCSAELRRPLVVADPELGFKPLLAKQREYQPDPGAGVDSAVCEALMALQAENEAARATTATPHAADKFVLHAAEELGFAPSPTAAATMLWATRVSAVCKVLRPAFAVIVHHAERSLRRGVASRCCR